MDTSSRKPPMLTKTQLSLRKKCVFSVHSRIRTMKFSLISQWNVLSILAGRQIWSKIIIIHVFTTTSAMHNWRNTSSYWRKLLYSFYKKRTAWVLKQLINRNSCLLSSSPPASWPGWRRLISKKNRSVEGDIDSFLVKWSRYLVSSHLLEAIFG